LKARKRKGQRYRLRSLFIVIFFTFFVTCLAYYFLILQPYLLTKSANKVSIDFSRAIIIDGIGFTKPNPTFLGRAREILVGSGLKVDVYNGSQVTIKLLDDLEGYGLIILRVHSAIEVKYGFLYLFSAEAYNRDRYTYEQSHGAYKEAYTFDSSEGPYFALRADLLGREDGLKGSTIILMGCNGTGSDHAIKRLFERGVKAIVAWDGYVSLEYTDEVTLTLLNLVYTEGLSYSEAVKKIMDIMGPDPTWKSRLIYLANPEG